MDEEMLRKILKEELEPIHADIKDIKKTLQEIESVNATRHVELMEDISDIKIVTSQNCFDIAKLKKIAMMLK
jgi:hypothetical protein